MVALWDLPFGSCLLPLRGRPTAMLQNKQRCFIFRPGAGGGVVSCPRGWEMAGSFCQVTKHTHEVAFPFLLSMAWFPMKEARSFPWPEFWSTCGAENQAGMCVCVCVWACMHTGGCWLVGTAAWDRAAVGRGCLKGEMSTSGRLGRAFEILSRRSTPLPPPPCRCQDSFQTPRMVSC